MSVVAFYKPTHHIGVFVGEPCVHLCEFVEIYADGQLLTRSYIEVYGIAYELTVRLDNSAEASAEGNVFENTT